MLRLCWNTSVAIRPLLLRRSSQRPSAQVLGVVAQYLPAAVGKYIWTWKTCKRVKADHVQQAYHLLYPLLLPTHSQRRAVFSLDFCELPVACSWHDFQVAGPEVHIDLPGLIWRVWLILVVGALAGKERRTLAMMKL